MPLSHPVWRYKFYEGDEIMEEQVPLEVKAYPNFVDLNGVGSIVVVRRWIVSELES